jgi:hypothetical protein
MREGQDFIKIREYLPKSAITQANGPLPRKEGWIPTFITSSTTPVIQELNERDTLQANAELQQRRSQHA